MVCISCFPGYGGSILQYKIRNPIGVQKDLTQGDVLSTLMWKLAVNTLLLELDNSNLKNVA